MKSFVFLYLISFPLVMVAQKENFKKDQLKYDRVKAAFDEKKEGVDQLFKEAGIENPVLFFRAFKEEQILEVWARNKTSTSFQLLKSFPFCATSGQLGPKRKQGDFQIPEGIYHIDRFNPQSNYYLSLGINYPNASDRLFCDPEKPGGDIFIHGNCVTIGCIPITDDLIKEVYVMVVVARNQGQKDIPVHIYPARLTSKKCEFLTKEWDYDKDRVRLWRNLKEIYSAFEMRHILPEITIDEHGLYQLP